MSDMMTFDHVVEVGSGRSKRQKVVKVDCGRDRYDEIFGGGGGGGGPVIPTVANPGASPDLQTFRKRLGIRPDLDSVRAEF